eukprot:759177-Hanusia_phi.AAC.3
MGANQSRENEEEARNGGDTTAEQQKIMGHERSQKEVRALDDAAMQEMSNMSMGHSSAPSRGRGVNNAEDRAREQEGQEEKKGAFDPPWFEKDLKAIFGREEASKRDANDRDLFTSFGDECDLCCCSSSRSRVHYESNQRGVSAFPALERVSLNSYSTMGMRGVRRSMPHDGAKPYADLKRNNVPMTAPCRIETDLSESSRHDVFEIINTSYTILDPHFSQMASKESQAREAPASERMGEVHGSVVKVNECTQTTTPALDLDKRQTPKCPSIDTEVQPACGSAAILSPTAKGGHTR